MREPNAARSAAGIFVYLLSLGFAGVTKSPSVTGEFEQIYRRLYHVLHKLRAATRPSLPHRDKTRGGAIS